MIEDLWTVTTYYNPARYANRYRNYQTFRRHLGTRLLVIELAETGQHQLKPADADLLLSLDGSSDIWQKERLLNIAFERLPRGVEYVAWVDCDLVFADPAWPVLTRRLLQGGKNFVQLFERAVHLPPLADGQERWPDGSWHSVEPLFFEESFASCLERDTYFDRQRLTRTQAELSSDNGVAPVAHGMAWAGHVQTLKAVGLYDACIIGGGDLAMALAVTGLTDKLMARRPMTNSHLSHYLTWARHFASHTRQSVSFVPGTIYHLWHGHYHRRHYKQRHETLRALGFDPLEHLEQAPSGVWRWAAHATKIQTAVNAYFHGRQEDRIDLQTA